jgi:phosphoglycerol transferase MdoB-like AlkP superfamily enzyme
MKYVADMAKRGTSATGRGVGDRPSPALVSAVYLVVLYLVHCLLVRAADYAALVQAEVPRESWLGPPVSLPLILGGELVLGAIAGAVLAALWRWRIPRSLWLVVAGAYMAFLALDQLTYKHFFSHLDYALLSESHDVANLSSSIVDSMDGCFWFNAVAAVVFAALVALPWRPRPIRALASLVARRPRLVAAGSAVYLALTAGLVAAADQHGLDRPFPIAFVESYVALTAEERELAQAVLDVGQSYEARPKGERSRTNNTAERHGNDVRPPTLPAGASEGSPSSSTSTSTKRKLNLVMYLMESASIHETSLVADARYDTTPFLKELSDESLLFTRYYSGVAASTRTFFSALSGLRPFIDKTSDMVKYSQIQVPNLVDILHDEGYGTAFFTSSDSRFDSLDTYLANRSYDVYTDANLLSAKDRRGAFLGYWGVDEEIVIDKALEWIEQVRDRGQPFLVNYNAVFPHHPYDVPPRHEKLTRLDWGGPPRHARYRASLRYSDLAVRRFYEGLERLGVLDDTLFVVLPDHGETFSDRHPGNLLHAGYAYDDDQHVFLMLRAPQVLGPAQRIDRLGTHADLLPTLLDVLGIDRELDIEGQNLLADEYRQPLIFYYSRRQYAVRDGDLKLVVNRKGRKVELFDLASDPTEQRDIAAERPDDVARLQAQIDRWRVEVTRAYRERVERTGLTDKQIRKLAKRRRAELFDEKRR